MKVVLTAPAKADLLEIGDWIASDSPANAQRFVHRRRTACDELSTLSFRYAEEPGTGLRRRPVGNYLVFYRVTDQVQIIRILHSGRDWLALLAEPT